MYVSNEVAAIFACMEHATRLSDLAAQSSMRISHQQYSVQSGEVAQSTGFCSTATNLASADPASGTTLYRQAINGGADTMIDSSLPPDSPNFTPLSYSRLNSRYLPRLNSCHCRCSSENGIACLFTAISLQLDRMPSATFFTNCSNNSCVVDGVKSPEQQAWHLACISDCDNSCISVFAYDTQET